MNAQAAITRAGTLDAMKAAKRWLIADPLKVPHYVTGQRRNGGLDTEQDRARLATYDAAREALTLKPGGWFLGFALGPDGNAFWQGIDLDKIAEKGIDDLAAGLPGYVETSPSGKGLHAIGYGRKFSSLGNNQTGIEAYAAGRFFTVTEDAVRDCEPCCLAEHVESVLAPRHRKKLPRNSGSSPANDRSSDDADRILAMLYERPNELSRHDWVRLGFALKHHFGDRARDAWLSFSSRYAGEITSGEAERQWETASPRGDVGIGTIVHLLGGYDHRSGAFQAGGAWRETIDPATGEVVEAPVIEPVDLFRQYSTPDLPIGLLPETIEAFARKQGDIMGVDPAGLAMAALAVCSAAISDEIAVQVKRNDPNWRESARLWVGLVGAPSMKKTPILKAAISPLRKIDSALMSAYMGNLAEYEALPAKERKGAERPKQERRMIADATIEAAQEVLKDSPRGVLSIQDELSGWFGSMDKYAPGKGAMADRGFWLQAYNGGPYSLNRISRGACYIPNCSIGLLGGIQPEPIRNIANDSHDDGLIQRLLPVILRTGDVGRDVPSDGAVAAYEQLVGRLNLMRPPTRSGLSYGSQAAPLQFDDRARTVRERLEAEHLDLVRALETISPKLAAHFGKFDGLFARLCVLWHCVETEQGTQPAEFINGDTAERVARFMAEFIRPSSIAFYSGLLGMSAGHEDLLALASWIVAAEIDEVKARDVQSSSQSFRHYTAEQVRTLCEKLEAFGWGEWADPVRNSNTRRFVVNPAVHSRFAERGREERERRAHHREIIRKALTPQ
jgi:hypothetical protein